MILTPDSSTGVSFLLQASGLGGLTPNTVLLSWPEQWEHDHMAIDKFVNMITDSTTFGHVITILKPEIAFNEEIKHSGTVDIWSFNYAKGMLLLFAHLLT